MSTIVFPRAFKVYCGIREGNQGNVAGLAEKLGP